MTLVVDASVALAWCFEDEASEATDGIFARAADEGAVVPELWVYELSNVLALARRRARISEAEVRRFLHVLDRLALERATAPASVELVGTAERYGVTAYDAAYLHLAMARGAELATLDSRLRTAASEAGVPLALGG